MQNLSQIINHLEQDYISKTVNTISNLLTKYNIGYLQNQPLVFYDGKEHLTRKPAFWLPQETNTIIDITKDKSTAENLKDLYDKNEFDSIIVTPRYTQNPSWQYSLIEEIASYAKQPTAYDMLPAEYR